MRMKTGFVAKFPPFQLQETKIQRTRRTRSESELPDKESYRNRNAENRDGRFQQNAFFKNKRTARDRVSWNFSNCWETYSSFGSHFGRTRSRHQRRVTFSNGGKTTDSWLSSGICIKHQPQADGNQDRTVLISRERDFCEVLGNQYCKSCRKAGLRKECVQVYESTYMAVKRYQEPRTFTPFSDIVLCRCPAIPQSDSRGLFNRLHELSSSSPEYFINYCEDPILSCSPTDADSQVFENTDIPLISTPGHSEDEELIQSGEDKAVQFEKDTKHEPEVEETHCSETPAIKTCGSTARTSTAVTTGTPVRKTNTFLPELQLREVKAKMQHILSSSTNTNEGNWVETFDRKKKGSFRERPIEPPQITVDFAMGIFDPKKRQLHKKINYAAVVPHETL